MKKSLLFPIILSGVLAVGVLSGHTAQAATTIRVGSYNLRAPKKNDTNKQRSVLENDKVEIAGTQEINHDNHRFSGKTKYNTLANFKDNTYKYIFYGNAINFAGGGYGIATVSSLPFTSKTNHKLYSSEAGSKYIKKLRRTYNNYNADKPSSVKALDKLSAKYGTKLVEPRVYQRVVVKKEGKEVAFYNTHLSYESAKIRTKQMKQLVKVMKKDAVKYTVLVGDFNADQNTKEWTIFTKAGFHIANGQDGVWHDTFIGDDDTMNVNSIDNIVTSRNITISNIHAIKSDASDHEPFVADLTLN